VPFPVAPVVSGVITLVVTIALGITSRHYNRRYEWSTVQTPERATYSIRADLFRDGMIGTVIVGVVVTVLTSLHEAGIL
jgi:hypothetical protein